MKHRLLISEILGWYGMIAIVFAYMLTSFGYISPTSIAYQGLNITGSLGIIIISLQKKVYQSVMLNTVWLLIAIISIAKTYF